MRAWQVTRYGRPTEALELLDVPERVPGRGELLVHTAASVANYNEVDGCHGRYLTINPRLPYTLGMECVGEVVGAGPGAEGWIGKRVTASARGARGAHADLVIAQTAMVFEAPPSLDDARAAAFFYPFHLAHLGLFQRGRVQAGETVLVHAAAGGVGSAAVQRGRGGAHGVGAGPLLRHVVGVILAYVDDAVARSDLRVPVPVPRFNAPAASIGRRVQARLLELLDAGAIRPLVGSTVPFERLPQALEDMEARSTIGRVVIER